MPTTTSPPTVVSPDRERIFQLWAHYADPQHSGYSPQLNAPIAPALAEEVPQVEAATRLFGPRTSDIVRGDNAFQAKYIYADTMFFRRAGIRTDERQPQRDPAPCRPGDACGVFFSRTIFGRKDPVGQLVLLNGTDSLTVMGLFRDPNPNQHLGGFNMLCSFEIVKRDLNTSWRGGDSFPSYVKLHKGASVAEVEAQLPAFFDRHGFTEDMKAWNRSYRFFPITESSRINTSAGLIAWVLMALAALTLFVASMNYVLISISTLVSRSKTIAMLKVGGARPSDIFRIFCSETAIMTFASVIVAGFLLWALQDQVLEITGTPMSELFALKRIWVPLLVILAAFALAALIPSRIFTSVPVTLAFRGVSDNRRRWKQTLLVAEIVSCTFTLTLLLLAVLQFDKLRNGDFGFEHDRIVYTYVKTPLGNISSVCDAVASLPEVDAAGASLEVPLWGYSGMPCIDENPRNCFSPAAGCFATRALYLRCGCTLSAAGTLRLRATP